MRIWLFGLFIFLFSLIVHAQPEIAVRAENLVDGDKITFGDIAEFKNLPVDDQKKISSLDISDAPNAGEVRKFTSFGLSEILRYNVPEVSNIRVIIPLEVVVRQKSFNLKNGQVEKTIISWVEDGCAPCKVSVTNIKLPDFTGVSGSATWELVKSGPVPKGSFYLGVNVRDRGTDVKKMWVSGDLRIFKNVPVLQKLVGPGIRLQKEDYSIESRDVTFTMDAVPSEKDLLGSELSRTLNAKEVIWKSLLKRKMVMKRGQPVNVVMKSDGWNVNVKGIAQGYGYIGDMIQVLNPMTNKFMVGVVLDDATIEVR